MAQIQRVEVHGDADLKNPLELKVGVRIVNSVDSFGM